MHSDPVTNVILSRVMPGRLDREEGILAAHAKALGLPITFGSVSMMERGRIELEPGALVAGAVPFVLQAFRRLGIEAPIHTPYPLALRPWLHRQVAWHPHLRDVLAQLEYSGQAVFIKPAKGWKRFTGFVTQFSDDPRFNGVSKSAPVWTSEPVALVSEWRAYVAHGEVLAIKFADQGGDRTIVPDEALIRQAVAQLTNAGQAPAGFVIDFGVDTAGRTLLIEVNDGFSFGAYGELDAQTYWAVTVARWVELINSVPARAR